MSNYRVLVTGNNQSNQSQIISSSPIKVDNYFQYQPGFSVEVFWRTSAKTQVGGVFTTPEVDESTILPEVAGTSAMIVTFPSAQDDAPEPIDLDKLIQETFARLPGLAETFEPEPPGYHLTNTIDYVAVLEGTVNLQLDQDSKVLNVGDIVVQNGTRHAWVNNSGNPVRLLVIMVGAERTEA